MTTLLVNTGTTTLSTSTANSYVVADNGILDINAGVTVSGVIDVNSDSNFPALTVSAVATVDNSVVVSGGAEYIDGKSLEASLDGGTQWVIGGGVASSTVAQAGGTQNVFGGDAYFTTLANGGTQNLFVGTGTEFDAEFTTVVGGGQQIVLDGSAYRTELDGGTQTVSRGANGPGFVSGTIIDGGGVAAFSDGGNGRGATVNDGEELIEANGLVTEDAVEADGFVDVFNLGLVEDENLFGEELVESGGIDFESFVQSGGLLTIQGNGIANGEDVFSGGHMVVMSNGSAGGVTIEGGTLELQNGAVVSGITLSGPGGTLKIDGTTMPTAAISGFGIGDTIDLASIPAGVVSAALLSGNVLQVVDGGSTYTIQLNPTQSFSGDTFNVASDGGSGFDITVTPGPNPAPPADTTVDMVMTDGSGDYEIYDIGGNAILAAYTLDQLPTSLTFAALGAFQAGDTSDMLLRNSSTGAFVAYYISADNVTSSALIGTVGTSFGFAGIGDFDGMSSLSELLLRNSSSGSFELYQVAGGGVLSGSSAGAVGNNFSVKGFGHFSEYSTTQIMMQDTSGDASNGQVELYTYQPGSASFTGIDVGKVGSNLTIVGMADLLGNGATQMVMQQNNGNFWLYTYQSSTNSLSGTLVGAIGSNFHVVGFGPLGTAGQDEMLMQDAAGDFEVYQYNATLNAFVGNSMGAVGAPWVVDGIASDPPSSSAAGASTAQLVQAMASMGGGAPVSTANGPTAGVELSQPTLLTTPHPA